MFQNWIKWMFWASSVGVLFCMFAFAVTSSIETTKAIAPIFGLSGVSFGVGMFIYAYLLDKKDR